MHNGVMMDVFGWTATLFQDKTVMLMGNKLVKDCMGFYWSPGHMWSHHNNSVSAYKFLIQLNGFLIEGCSSILDDSDFNLPLFSLTEKSFENYLRKQWE